MVLTFILMDTSFLLGLEQRIAWMGIFLIGVGSVLLGCGAPSSSDEKARAESTIEMAARLDTILQEARANPRDNLYINQYRAERLRELPEPSRPGKWFDHTVRLAKELLRAGENEAAIEHYTRLLRFAEERGAPPSTIVGIKDRLAISYLRRGEMRNCVYEPNPSRCLLPIQEEGVYKHKEGARKAVELYKEILEADPDYRSAEWLLNVAAMAAGDYPQNVPESNYVPMDFLADKTSFPRFPNVASSLGVDVMGLSGGAVVDDFSGNGNLDIMTSSWGLSDQLRYFVNKGDGTFEERTTQAGLEGLEGGLNMKQADFNNDGHLDVLILRGAWYPRGHPNSLLRNDGDGTFTDVTMRAGLGEAHPTQTAAWGDYNNDGELDLFIGNESATRGNDTEWAPVSPGTHPAELYRNNGNGTFTDVAVEAGVDVTEYIKGVQWGDIDNDGDLDLYISILNAPNRLYRNDREGSDSERKFTDITEQAGVAEPVESFPTWFWDVNNDGYLDLFVSGWAASAGDMVREARGESSDAAMSRLYLNNGDGTFSDITEKAGLDKKVMYSMGANYGDLDNDGWLDFYVGTGDPDFRSLMPSRLFRNTGSLSFEEVTTPTGTGHLQKGHAVSFADLTNNGYQDIYAVMGGAFEGDVFHNALFKNPGFENHWITLRLVGDQANRSAIGARIKVIATGDNTERTVYRTVGSGGSFGASSLQQGIGLGQADSIRAVEVQWPGSGYTQRFMGLKVNHFYRLREGRPTPTRIDKEKIMFEGNPQ
jgi:tetratricopeptide (TPR) repeat protein